jgi:hypothetical protein
MAKKKAKKKSSKLPKKLPPPPLTKKPMSKTAIVLIISAGAVGILTLLLLVNSVLVGQGISFAKFDDGGSNQLQEINQQIIQQTCGNGIVEGTEECDNGGVCSANQLPCSPTKTTCGSPDHTCNMGGSLCNNDCTDIQVQIQPIEQVEVNVADPQQLPTVTPVGILNLAVVTYDLEGRFKDNFHVGEEFEVRVYISDTEDLYGANVIVDINGGAEFTETAWNGELFDLPVSMSRHASKIRWFYKDLGTVLSSLSGENKLLFTTRAKALVDGPTSIVFAVADLSTVNQGQFYPTEEKFADILILPPATCNDDIQNQDESDLDCGGICSPCTTGFACEVKSDCIDSESCVDSLCGSGSLLPPGAPQKDTDLLDGIAATFVEGNSCNVDNPCNPGDFCNANSQCEFTKLKRLAGMINAVKAWLGLTVQ